MYPPRDGERHSVWQEEYLGKWIWVHLPQTRVRLVVHAAQQETDA
jgi:hypothetical protein